MRLALFGGVAALVLASGPVVLAAPTVDSAARPHTDRHQADRQHGCQGAPASARVMKGTSKWRDPDTLTHRQMMRLESKSDKVAARGPSNPGQRPNGSVKIAVHFHIVTDNAGNGGVPMSGIKTQIAVLNQAYSGQTGPRAANTPFRFELSSVSHTANSRWYNADYFTDEGKAQLNAMKRALRVGGAEDLNIYTVGPKFQLLGYATFPVEYQSRPKLDGVVVLNGSLPGGDADFGPGAVYNEGDTATHEVGHWLNLYHTFQGSCGPLNDLVTDTPRQFAGDNIFECNAALDTCAKDVGRDPVHNFMNYTDDPCMNQFTWGQRIRMSESWFIRQALS
jgi:hypothetical protein